MPNHVTHRIAITGPKAKVDAFAATFLVEESDKNYQGETESWLTFDFNKLVPMPEIVKTSESSSTVTIGLALMDRGDVHTSFGYNTLDDMLSWPWVIKEGIQDVEALRAHLMKMYPDAIEKAKVAIKCYEETGHTDWYGWSIDNWGTKWGAYNVEFTRIDDTTLEIMFDTAWSVPEPVFVALSNRAEVQGLTIKIVAFEEGWSFAYRGTMDDQGFIGEELEATSELYEEVYGEKPCDDEEDEDS